MPRGVALQFGLVLQSEFFHQIGTVVFDRPWANVQAYRNLGTGHPLGRELQYLALARRQGFVRVEWAGFGLLDIGVDRDFRNWRAEEPPPRGCLTDGLDDFLLCAAFEHLAVRPG